MRVGFFSSECALPGLGAEGWQVCSLPNSPRSLSGRSGRVMERNNDGKKSRGSQSAGIVPDTRVLRHWLSPATRYRGKRAQSDSWLADTDQPSFLYIYMYISPQRSTRPFPLEEKPTGFPSEPGHTGAEREQMCSTSSTWALGHHHCALQQPRIVLLSISHLRAAHPPAEVD